ARRHARARHRRGLLDARAERRHPPSRATEDGEQPWPLGHARTGPRAAASRPSCPCPCLSSAFDPPPPPCLSFAEIGATPCPGSRSSYRLTPPTSSSKDPPPSSPR